MSAIIKEAKTVLLIIDVQDSFKASPKRWSRRSNPNFEANISRLIQAFRAAGQPIIFVLHSDEDASFERSSPHYKLMDFLNVQDELILHKVSRSVFASTDLHQHLEDLACKHLVITGIQTEQCCETTARQAGDLGYDVDFVTEATLTFPIKHWQENKELSTKAIVERTEYALAGRFAQIKTVDEVCNVLPKGHPA